MNPKHKEAIDAMLYHEMSDYDIDFHVEYDDMFGEDCYYVSFPNYRHRFNSAYIKVAELWHEEDEDMIAYSDFSVNVYEDLWYDFNISDPSIKELWKQILWQTK